MTLVDNTDPSQTDAITFELALPHAPDKVWRALTEPALLAEWLLPLVEGQLDSGTAFKLQAPPQPKNLDLLPLHPNSRNRPPALISAGWLEVLAWPECPPPKLRARPIPRREESID